MKVTFALPKGRLFEESISLLRVKGLLSEDVKEGRKLVIESRDFSILLVKPFDVPVYVEQGVADIGIAGRDVLLERDPDIYEFIDLGIGKCKIVVAGKPEDVKKYGNCPYIKVATKYPNIAKNFFERKNIKTKIITLSGSVEIAPLLGLSDFIVDLVQTGRTLEENGLIVIEEIGESTAKLVANKVSFLNKRENITKIIGKLL